MRWVRVDVDALDHPKFLALDPEAVVLWLYGLGYCARQLTDGHIPAAILRRLGALQDPDRAAAQLMEAGLWDATDDGYVVHDYLDYQPSRERVLNDRERARERQKRRRSPQPVDNVSRRDSRRDIDRSHSVTGSGERSINSETPTETSDPPDSDDDRYYGDRNMSRRDIARSHGVSHSPHVTSRDVTKSSSSSVITEGAESAGDDDDGSETAGSRTPPANTDELIAAAAGHIGGEAHDAAVRRGGVTSPQNHRRACIRSAHAEHATRLRQVLAEHPELDARSLADVVLGRRTPDGRRFYPGVGAVGEADP